MSFQPQVDLPRVSEPANEADVLREQLDYLIAHNEEHRELDCTECHRYLRARAALLEVAETVVYGGVAIASRRPKAA